MNLKPLVNDPKLWAAFLLELDQRMKLAHKKLETASDAVDLHRAQGEARLIRQLRQLREKVNGDA